MPSVAADLGIQLESEVWSDVSPALGAIKWRCLDNQTYRHVFVWIQQVVAEKRVKFGKASGRDKPADLFTKHLDLDTIMRHCARMSALFEDGRAAAAPHLHLEAL